MCQLQVTFVRLAQTSHYVPGLGVSFQPASSESKGRRQQSRREPPFSNFFCNVPTHTSTTKPQHYAAPRPWLRVMDSIHHLSTSLPRTRRRLDQPELLSDFKAAALSVTNLYKTAAAQQDKARAAGYQDAVEDLLAFLDAENLGLMDGEGWRVRQWATQSLADDGTIRQGGSDDEADEQRRDAGTRAVSRSSSPEVGRKPNPMPAHVAELQEEERSTARRHTASEPPTARPPTTAIQQVPTSDTFTFRSAQAYPTNHDRESSMDLDTASTAPATPTSVSTATPDSASVRIIPRSNRGSRHNRRQATTSTNGNNISTINLNLGSGAGSKRKIPYPDFFDISGMNFEGHGGKDNGSGRGGKRGRHV